MNGMKALMLLGVLSASTIAAATATERPFDVCEIVFNNGSYRVYKGNKVFSPELTDLDEVLKTQSGLLDNGICRLQKSVCSLRYDAATAQYYVYKDSQPISPGFREIREAEDVVNRLVNHQDCTTPDL